MRLGYYSDYADVIEQEELIKLGRCGDLVRELATLTNHEGLVPVNEKIDMDMKNLAQMFVYDYHAYDDDLAERITKKYDELREEFEKVTGGLTLDINHHSGGEGDRYDEVQGAFWEVGNMYTLTPAGEKHRKIVKRSFYVTYR